MNRKTRYNRKAECLAAGALAAVPSMISDVWILSFVLYIPFSFFLLQALMPREDERPCAVASGMTAMFGYYLAFWSFFTAMYPLDFIDGLSGGEALILVVLCTVLLAALQTLFCVLPLILLSKFSLTGVIKRFPLLLPIAVAAFVTLSEWLQNFTWLGVPFCSVALGVRNCTVFLQNASLFGHCGLTFVITAINAYFGFALLPSARKKMRGTALIASVCLLGFGFSVGGVLYCMPHETGKTIRVACLQSNYTSVNVADFNSITSYRIGAAQVREAAKSGAELAVWSESALTESLPGSEYDKALSKLSKENHIAQIVGALEADENGNRYNKLYYYDKNGVLSDVDYAKRHLVPFGEYLPFGDFFPMFFPLLASLSRDLLVNGKDATVFETEEAGNPGGLICFDSIYASLSRDTVNGGADYLVLATNDAWFEGSYGISVHEGHAVLRAVESGRYVVRVAATGISSVITDKGEITVQSEESIRTVIYGDAETKTYTTLYSVIGDVLPIMCALFLILPTAADAVVRKKRM